MDYTILLVDDQEQIRDLVEEALEQEGYTVLGAASAEQALMVLESHPVDVVISDEVMPGMSGSDLLAIVRKKYPDTIRIILSGHANINSAIKAINEGEVYRFFTKPCNMADLTVSIRQGLNQKELERENRRLLSLLKEKNVCEESMKQEHPELFEVKRDASGAVIIDEE
jgi:two-component system, probable response regulator PhcQ